eukprot:TCONS_00055548-protein
MALLPISNRIAFILSTIFALVHYGKALNDNSTTTLKENDIWCGGKWIIYKSQGQLDVDLSILLNSSIVVTNPPYECHFKIRANTPISFQWFKFSRNFTGKYGDCNQTNNIVKVWTGCQDREEHCFTNYMQSNYELHASDGCYDIELSTDIKDKIFLANFKPAWFNTASTPYDDDSTSSSFSNHLVFIIIGPIVFLIAVIGITFALMRQAQHRRLVDTLQVEQNLISQQTSSSSEAQEECPNSPTSLLQKTERQLSNDSKARYSQRFSQQFQEGMTDHYYYPAKRISYISNRYSRNMPAEYRVSRVRCSRSYSAGESSMPRPPGEIARRSIARRSPTHSADWSNKVQLVDVHSPKVQHPQNVVHQLQHQTSYHQQQPILHSQQSVQHLQHQTSYQQQLSNNPQQLQHQNSQFQHPTSHDQPQPNTNYDPPQQLPLTPSSTMISPPQISPTAIQEEEEAPPYEKVIAQGNAD